MNAIDDDHSFAAFVGLDWADKKHDVCLRESGSERLERNVLVHEPSALDAWAQSLRQRFGGQRVAVCLELTRGPIVSALQRHDLFVLFPVNPATLAKYRQAFYPSGAKDDPSDAELALELVTRHRDRLRRLQPQSAAMRALQQLVVARRTMVDDATRIINRLIAALKTYFPQALDWFEQRNTRLFCDFLSRWSCLEAVQRARRKTLGAFFVAHHVRRRALIDRRIDAIRGATPLTTDAGVVDPARLLVETLAPQLRLVLGNIDRYDEAIAERCASHDDFPLFAALPGAGPALAPRLLAAFGEQRDRFASAAALQRYAGIAPVTERSGNKCWVHWRMRCPKFLRQTFVEWAAQTIHHSFWARAFYHQQRTRGASHQATLRALAFKWIRILYRCWMQRSPYDENRYLMSLQKKGSSLLQNVATNTS